MATGKVTDSSFESDVLKAADLVLVDFWAEWCGPCRALGPKLEELSSELQGKVRILKCNVDENPESPSRYGVRGIPTMILFRNGKDLDQMVGNLPKEDILKAIQKHV